MYRYKTRRNTDTTLVVKDIHSYIDTPLEDIQIQN